MRSAVGAPFYLEPASTLDVNVFVTVRTAPASSLLSLSPIIDYLKGQGRAMKAEYVIIAGWSVGLKPIVPDTMEVWFGRLLLGQIDLSTANQSANV